MTGTKIIEDARLCAEKLNSAGLRNWADQILDAIDSGSTGGEIVMGVRFNLQKLLAEKIQIPAEVRQLAQTIITEINATGW